MGGVGICCDAEPSLLTDVRPVIAERHLLQEDEIHGLVAPQANDLPCPTRRGNTTSKIGRDRSQHTRRLDPVTDNALIAPPALVPYGK